jgi:hypothetical protein
MPRRFGRDPDQLSFIGRIALLAFGYAEAETIDLSFSRVFTRHCHLLVGVNGIEPLTSALSELRSNQLSYTPTKR